MDLPTHYPLILNQWEQIKSQLNDVDMDVIKAAHCIRLANRNARKVLKVVNAEIAELLKKLQEVDYIVRKRNDAERKKQSDRVYNFDPNTYVRKEEEDASE